MFTAILSSRYRDFPYTSYLHVCISSPIIYIPHQSGTFVTNDEPTLKYNHPNPQFILPFTLDSVHFMSWDKWIIICIHHYRMIQSICAWVLSHFSRVQLCATLWTIVHQAPLSMGFSKQEYWSGVVMPSPRGSSPSRDRTWISCLAGGFFTHWATWEAHRVFSLP